MTYRPRRSVLFMPASNARALEKALTLKADAIIFDLEDSVGPEDKGLARDQAYNAIVSEDYGLRELIIRVNSYQSEWGEEDLQAACDAEADAILVPKIDDGIDVENLLQLMDDFGAPDDMKLWVMMETPKAVLYSGEIAETSLEEGRRLSCFVLGTNDLAKDTGASMGEERWAMMSWLQTCVLAAKAHGLTVLDSVYNDFSDADGFQRECQQGRSMGIDGKALIHPSQIDIANEVFGPSASEIEWSEKVLEAFQLPENSGKGVISLDGKMVERLHMEMAERVVEIAEAIQRMENGE